MTAELIARLESAAPSRKMAFLAAFGMFSIFMLLSALSGRFGASERLSHIIIDIGFAAAVVTWIEARRFKYIASELRSQQEALAAAALKARGV